MAPVLDTRPSIVVGVLAVAFCAAAASSPAATAACNGFGLTPGQIGGTHFKASPVRRSVLGPGIHGTRITLTGYVLTSGCRAVRGARVDFWQADENGVYDDKAPGYGAISSRTVRAATGSRRSCRGRTQTVRAISM